MREGNNPAFDDIGFCRRGADIEHHDGLYRLFDNGADSTEDLDFIEARLETCTGNNVLEQFEFIIVYGDNKHLNCFFLNIFF